MDSQITYIPYIDVNILNRRKIKTQKYGKFRKGKFVYATSQSLNKTNFQRLIALGINVWLTRGHFRLIKLV